MGHFSKYFREAVRDRSCADFFHPGKTCTRAKLDLAPVLITGAMKYFLPIILFSTVSKFEWTKEFFQRQCKLVVKMIILGSLPTMITLSVFCGFFDYLKKHYYQFYALPLACGALGIALTFPTSFLNVLACGTANHFIELIVDATALSELKHNGMLCTLSFMTLSSAIVYLFKTTQYRPFWLLHVPHQLSPEKFDTLQNSHGWFDLILKREGIICQHKHNCEDFLWQVRK